MLRPQLSGLYLSLGGVLEFSKFCLSNQPGIEKMPTCTRTGCGKQFDEDNNNQDDCMFHPGGISFTLRIASD